MKAPGKHFHGAPFTDGKAAMPHYDDVTEKGASPVSASPTPPGREPMTAGSMKTPENTSAKIRDMDEFRAPPEGMGLTTDKGTRIADNQNTLSVGPRGPRLLEDFHFTEKLAHFGRERIPERVVHARGSGAHGYFQVYKPLPTLTKAHFLNNPQM